MMLGKVVGNVWATKKEEGMENLKLLIVEPLDISNGDHSNQGRGQMVIAADRIGAGQGEFVLVSRGTPARVLFSDRTIPIDAVVIGIVDSYEMANEEDAP